VVMSPLMATRVQCPARIFTFIGTSTVAVSHWYSAAIGSQCRMLVQILLRGMMLALWWIQNYLGFEAMPAMVPASVRLVSVGTIGHSDSFVVSERQCDIFCTLAIVSA
jgi:hypothetical protein